MFACARLWRPLCVSALLAAGAVACGGPTAPSSATQSACTASISTDQQTQTVGAAGATFVLTVTAGDGCAWTAVTASDFIRVTDGGSGTGSGVVRVTVSANGGAQRVGTLTVAGSTVTVTQQAAGPANCLMTVEPTGASVPASGGDVTVNVTVTQGSGCVWSASVTAGFVTIKSGGAGTGTGAAVFTVAANTGAARSATIAIAGQTLTISQVAAGCAFTVTPTTVSVSASAQTATITVTVTQGAGCTWTAAANDAFVTVSSGASGTGSGTVVLAVAANVGGARSGGATIAGQTVSVAQAAAPCAFAVTPGNTTISPAAQTVTETVTVTQGIACTWTATSASPFITVTSGASGTGNGSVTLAIAANAGTGRTGTLTIAGATVLVTQTGVPFVLLSFRSAPGDSVGGGQSYSFVGQSPPAAVSIDAAYRNFTVSSTAGPASWSLHLSAPVGASLVPGLLDDTARWPVQATTQPGLDFTFGGRGCNASTGRFVIGDASYSGTDIQRFHAVFEQHCENASAALVGDIWVDAAGTSTVPPLSLPSGPASPVTLFSTQSAVGDPIGRGQSSSYALSSAVFTPTLDTDRRHVNVRVAGPDGTTFWLLDFGAPAGQQLAAGVYANAARWPFQPGTVPGLSVTGNGAGCNTVTGQFTILEIQYDASNAVQRFHATFEQHCDGAVPGLTGEIFVVANPWR